MLSNVTIILYYFNLWQIKCSQGGNLKTYPKQMQRNPPFSYQSCKDCVHEACDLFSRICLSGLDSRDQDNYIINVLLMFR